MEDVPTYLIALLSMDREFTVYVGLSGLSDLQLSQCERPSLALGETSRGVAFVFLGQRSCHCVSWAKTLTLFLHVAKPVEILQAKFLTNPWVTSRYYT